MSEIKPDAWLLMDSTIISNYSYNLRKHKEDGDIPLFAKAPWVDLTDDDMLMIYGQQHEGKKYSLGRMVQAKLKEKNYDNRN
jgi:hypothetical protein